MNKLTKLLFESQDINYKTFSEKLIPDTCHPIIGVRSPKVKIIAKQTTLDKAVANEFLMEKHVYYEEFLLHGFIIAQEKNDLTKVLTLLENFLPQIDNWGVCDSTVMALKIFRKNQNTVFEKVKLWIKSDKPYTVRFALVTLLSYFTDERYCDHILSLSQSACRDHYYINMAIAWLLSVMLIKHYEKTICLLKSKTLPKFVHNKAIQKAIESYRIPDKNKNFLRKLKL